MIILDVNLVVDDENGYYCEGNELWFIIFGWWSLDLINDVGYWLIIVDFNGSSIFNEGYMVKMWWCVQYVYGRNSWDNEGWILLSFVLWEWCFRMLYTCWMDCSMLKMVEKFIGKFFMLAEILEGLGVKILVDWWCISVITRLWTLIGCNVTC